MEMEFREVWSDSNFEEMTWHDCRVYAVTFPDEHFRIDFDIDYVHKWELHKGFWVSPCRWTFNDISSVKFDIFFDKTLSLSINNVKRDNRHYSPNGKVLLWNYQFDFDEGLISFVASGFNMRALAPPKLSSSMDLGRN